MSWGRAVASYRAVPSLGWVFVGWLRAVQKGNHGMIRNHLIRFGLTSLSFLMGNINTQAQAFTSDFSSTPAGVTLFQAAGAAGGGGLIEDGYRKLTKTRTAPWVAPSSPTSAKARPSKNFTPPSRPSCSAPFAAAAADHSRRMVSVLVSLLPEAWPIRPS